MKIEIQFRSTYKSLPPVCQISSRHTQHNVEIQKQFTFTQDFDLKLKDFLHIEFVNKDGIDNNIVYIDGIKIDDINLQHYIYDGIFYPEYDSNWLEQQTVKPPQTYQPCTELRLKGIWKLSIITPIWKMIMEKWLNDHR